MESKNQKQINIDDSKIDVIKRNDFQKIIDMFSNLGKRGVLNILYILGISTVFLRWLEFDYSSSTTYVYSIFSESFQKRYGSVDLLYVVPLSYVALIINNMINEKTKDIVAFFLSSVVTGIVGLYFIDIYVASNRFTVGYGAQLSFVISLIIIFVSFIEINKSSDFKVGEDYGIKTWLEYYYKNTFNFSGAEKYPYYWRYEIFLAGIFFVVCTFVSLVIVLVVELNEEDVPNVVGMVINIFFLVIYLPSVGLYLRYLKRNKDKNMTQVMDDNLSQQNNINYNTYQPAQAQQVNNMATNPLGDQAVQQQQVNMTANTLTGQSAQVQQEQVPPMSNAYVNQVHQVNVSVNPFGDQPVIPTQAHSELEARVEKPVQNQQPMMQQQTSVIKEEASVAVQQVPTATQEPTQVQQTPSAPVFAQGSVRKKKLRGR